jgi:hypothetical protein
MTTDEIVKRLRFWIGFFQEGGEKEIYGDLETAMHRLEALEAENQRLREALERAAGAIQSMHTGHSHAGENGEALIARAALKGEEK